jgi:hypothetical protein
MQGALARRLDEALPAQEAIVAPTDPRAHVLLKAWSEYSGLIERAGAIAIDELARCRADAEAKDREERPIFQAQDRSLLADGLHYETRIAQRGVLATREHNAHDLFNALIWLRHPQLKRALNVRQVADIEQVGAKQRTRGQCALTHFDEAGGIVWLTDPSLLALWDAHDWVGLFRDRRDAWGRSIAVSVFGHALIEHVWSGHVLPVAKALAVAVTPQQFAALRTIRGAIAYGGFAGENAVAAAIAQGTLLADPQELRPLPLAGIPGWHEGNEHASFYAEAPCFRARREGRSYPPPLTF